MDKKLPLISVEKPLPKTKEGYIDLAELQIRAEAEIEEKERLRIERAHKEQERILERHRKSQEALDSMTSKILSDNESLFQQRLEEEKAKAVAEAEERVRKEFSKNDENLDQSYLNLTRGVFNE